MALSADHSNGSHTPVVPLWINGEAATASKPVQFPVTSYAEQKDVVVAESADVDAAKRAADAAWSAFQTWQHASVVTRRDLLHRYSALLRERSEQLVEAQILETSVSKQWAEKNVTLATNLIDEVAACISQMKGEIPPTATPGSIALAFTVPIGPVLTIAPWNSSVILAARGLATAIAAGCTMVFKASELCPRTHHLLVQIFEEAGLPKGAINVLQTRREDAAEVTEALIAHRRMRKVEFVGSAGVGKIIGQICAKHLKPILMELGGKGPAIVLDDANLADAAKKCIAGAFLHHGQLCFSTERIIVLEKVAPEFQELLKKEAQAFPVSSGVSARIVEASQEKLADAEKKGAKFLVGGPRFKNNSTLEPTILTNLKPDMALWDDEAFGPSVSLFIASDDAHAIDMANDSAYGLNAAVHSSNMERALAVARKIECAQVHVNSMTAHDEPTLPVGGMKASGWGRNNSLWGLREFCEIKLVTLSMKGNDFL
ncbi:ALDH-like protein [Teratosphaeria nubilosa]|uniref:ALDH-like protein n=1 Tax=Teratosphaeria nubilosa TaxID=161662 RepID=A0A6G1LIS1_9PEZI|nr:ALDH-like protein [Teratosphaeria nubilosa]